MRSAIDRDADPQQMIPKLTCVLLKLVRPSFRNSSNCALGVQMKLCSLSPWQKDDVYQGQYMARNVAKDDLEAQREALSSHGHSAYSSRGSKTPRTLGSGRAVDVR